MNTVILWLLAIAAGSVWAADAEYSSSFQIWIGGDLVNEVGPGNYTFGGCESIDMWQYHNNTWDEYYDAVDACLQNATSAQLDMIYNSTSSVSQVPDVSYPNLTLYALVDNEEFTVLSVATKVETLQDVASRYKSFKRDNENINIDVSNDLSVVSVNDSFTQVYKPLPELVRHGFAHFSEHSRESSDFDELVKRSFWLRVAEYLLLYVIGGVVLHAAAKHTGSGAVRKVYQLYMILAIGVAEFLGDFAGLMVQSFLNAHRNTRGFTATGALDDVSNILDDSVLGEKY